MGPRQDAAPTPDSGDSNPEVEQVTQLLERIRAGDEAAESELLPLVYTKLRGLGRAVFSGQNPNHTLQATALVHEAWLKLAGHLDPIENRRHFLIVAGRAMRQVVVDHARAKRRDKRGGGQQAVTLDADLDAVDGGAVDFVELDDCLERLRERNARHARVAELRLFSGLSIDETALTLDVSPRTVDADWAMAKAWLRRELAG